MKKKILFRGLLGFPLGISLGYVITILISLGWANGYYSPCVPSLVQTMGNEINAVIFQTILSGLLGSTFAASYTIWEMDDWSIVKQTGLYFLIVSIVMMPIAYMANWMPHTMLGFISYFGIFVFIFIVVWIAQYFIWKSKIKHMNAKLR